MIKRTIRKEVMNVVERPQKPHNLFVFVFLVSVCGFLSDVSAEEQAKAAPEYLNLRYDEDFSYLGGPESSYVKDPWDPIKWIPIGDEWHLTLGGQARLRFESETNKSFGSTTPSHDAFGLQRYFSGLAGLEDHADFHQGFMDIPTAFFDQPATFRLGRQELQYGAQRLISPLDWGNLRRAFDGIKVFYDLVGWRLDAFAVRPVINDRRNLDDEDENRDFYGLYTTWKGNKALAADFYFLLLKGRRTLYTLGNRLYGKRGSWDYETEAAAQFGTYAGDRVRAWMATVGGGYTFADVMWKPRAALLYDYASGDRDPTDGTHGTFNQHFPLGHAWLGYLDLVGRSNIHAIKTQLKVKPSQKVIAWADFHTFFADQDRDALYSAGGTPTRRAAGGAGSHTFGHELDLTVKYALNIHTAVLAGWAHMWPGGFIQIEYKF
ncbi:MAG: alginate export family protein [Planctomycetota bacterium]|jgi:hypothetical protein